MTYEEKDLIISRITSGTHRCRIYFNKEESMFILKHASREDRYIANELYKEIKDEAKLFGGIDSEEMLDWMLVQNLWNENKQERLDGLKDDIDKIKVKMFEMTFQTRQRKQIRQKLQEAKDEVATLTNERHAYDYATCEGVASSVKLKYLLGAGLHYANGTPYWDNEKNWDSGDNLLDKIANHYQQNRITDPQSRELARSDPWASIWASEQSPQAIFGHPSCDMDVEQHMLINWSKLYDNVRQHPKAPPANILEDDDMLDGWLIIQRQEGELAKKKSLMDEKLKNSKIANSGEIFIPADEQVDASFIDSFNEPDAKYIKKQRMNLLKKEGRVKEMDMPDTKNRFAQAVSERTRNTIKRGKGK
jgi:hypothetical protein